MESFTTGFESASDDTLKALLGHPPGTAPLPKNAKRNEMGIAVLDDRSTRDNTIALSILVPSDISDAQRNGTESESDDLIWWKCRLPFNQSWDFYAGLQHYGTYETWCDDTFVDEDGVLDVPAMLEAADD